MTALVISISSDVSVESVGFFFPRVILIGSVSVEVLVAPEVGAAAVASPVGVLKLDTIHHDSESHTEIPKRHVSSTPHDAMLTRWRSRVASGSSSPATSILEIPTAPILPAPSAIVAPSYKFPHAPVALTSRKTVRPLPSHRLALRSALLFTMYPPMTSESSAGDYSLESSAELSRKRCRSPAATVISSIHATRALVTSHADLLPPRKRFRDSISPKDSVEEDIDTDMLEGIEADDTAVEVVVDRDVEAGIDVGFGMEVDVRIDILDGMLMPNAVERLEHVEKGLHNIYDHVI
nr:hypothetical protein [Tanacetum cinerariifolium]